MPSAFFSRAAPPNGQLPWNEPSSAGHPTLEGGGAAGEQWTLEDASVPVTSARSQPQRALQRPEGFSAHPPRGAVGLKARGCGDA